MNQADQRRDAEARFSEAKERMTVAAKAAIAGNPVATTLAQQALTDVARAREELRALDDADRASAKTFGTPRSIARATR